MDGKTRTLGGVLGATLLTIAALSTVSCEDTDGSGDGGMSDGNFFGDLAKQCGLSCPDKGVVDGNFAISGYAAIDSFFRSVVNFNTTAHGVSADIDAELRGIQTLVGITEAQARADLSGAIKTKLQADYGAKLVVYSQPARCEVDASIAAKATLDCQAEAGCTVDRGKVAFDCKGTCTVEANVDGMCSANADVRCEVSGPQVDCKGECSGTCTATLMAAAACSGTCRGTCSAGCSAAGDANGDGVTAAGECVGTCSGMCQGSCDLTGMAALNCQGRCNGSCEYTPPMGGCTADANVSCDLKAEAKAQCTGRCEGEFEPPKVNCEASASCEASAKAEAKFEVHCTPPSVEVRLEVAGDVMAQAKAKLVIDQLQARLPRLAAATARARVVNDAGSKLVADGKAAVQGTISGFQAGRVGAIAAYRIANCVPSELNESAQAIQSAQAELNAKISSANAVGTAFGMVM